MKALSVWQPYASLIIDGHKRFETRSWPTRYRGSLVICAGTHELSLLERRDIGYRPQVLGKDVEWYFLLGYPGLPFGKALGIVTLVNCFQATEMHLPLSEKEEALGDFSWGRWVWVLQDPRRFKEPFPVRGQQGLFNIPDELIAGREMKV